MSSEVTEYVSVLKEDGEAAQAPFNTQRRICGTRAMVVFSAGVDF